MFRKNHRQHKKLHNQAYLAFDVGDLQTAADKFAELAKAHPDNAQYRYMLGLAAKYRMDWALSLQANLAAIACAPEFDEAAHWNAAIAATKSVWRAKKAGSCRTSHTSSTGAHW